MGKFLYKYKEIKTTDQLTYLIDTIQHNRIYFPRYDELNDPLESSASYIMFDGGGYAGISLAYDAGEDSQYVADEKKKFCLLSLAESPLITQMWAHYSGNYSGICLCYSKTGPFSDAKPIEYVEKQEEALYSDDALFSEAIKDSFYKKQKDWEYEKESRIVQKREDGASCYFDYPRECLKAIIFGEKMNEELIAAIRAITPNDIQLFKTRVESAKFRLVIVPLEFDDIFNRNSKSRFVSQDNFEKNVLEGKYKYISFGLNQLVK